MKTEFKNIIEVLDYFKDEETCKKLLELQRWGGKPICPHCGCDKVYRTNRGYRCSDKTCFKKFSVTVGTIFENSKIKLRLWFTAIYICTSNKKGVSSHQLSRDLGVTQKTAWFILQRVREMLKENAPQLLNDIVEIDETYVGGKARNKHAWQRKLIRERGTGYIDKTMVFGILQRKSKVLTHVVSRNDGNVLKPIIRNIVENGTIVMTDGFGAYAGLDKDYQHEVINHHKGEYFREGFHTNTIEGFWSILKRGIVGIYHHVSPEHLHRYCNEFSYRYNTRSQTDTERFVNVLKRVDSGSLTYNKLTGK